jgi:GTP-binding protein HflX
LTGEGVQELLATIENHVGAGRHTFEITLDAADGAGLNWLYEQAEVMDRSEAGETTILMTIRIAPEKEPRLLQRFPAARQIS